MTVERQLERWVAGDPVHNSETDECCPDFSCCRPDLIWPVEDRRKFAEAYINEDSETTHFMCMDALGDLVKSLNEKVHIAGESDGC